MGVRKRRTCTCEPVRHATQQEMACGVTQIVPGPRMYESVGSFSRGSRSTAEDAECIDANTLEKVFHNAS